jgi:hypothetical protein
MHVHVRIMGMKLPQAVASTSNFPYRTLMISSLDSVMTED